MGYETLRRTTAMALPGISPSTAKKIIRYRDQQATENKQNLAQIIGKSKAKTSKQNYF